MRGTIRMQDNNAIILPSLIMSRGYPDAGIQNHVLIHWPEMKEKYRCRNSALPPEEESQCMFICVP